MEFESGLTLLRPHEFATCYDRSMLEAAIRRRCHTVGVDNETVLCRILGRFKFFVDRRDIGLAPHLMLDGFWEYWVSDFIWRNVSHGECVLDIGANVGYYSVLMAELIGSSGQILSFEPNPRMHELLCRNIEINGLSDRTECHAVAASDRSGDLLPFRVRISDPKNGALLPAPAPGTAPVGFLDFQVTSMAMDDATIRPVDFVKIDVEGAEQLLWAGMQKLIARSPRIKILMEFNPFRYHEPERWLNEIGGTFALRQLGSDAVIRATTAEQLLSSRSDVMLYLSHHDPVDFQRLG